MPKNIFNLTLGNEFNIDNFFSQTGLIGSLSTQAFRVYGTDVNNPTFNINTISNTVTITGTGQVTNAPTNSTDITNKAYVDAIAQGLTVLAPCVTCTNAAGDLAGAVYNNGTNGVGATLTGAVTVPALSGYTPALTERVLIKNQADETQNGIYTLTQVNPYIFTRATDMDGSPNYDVRNGDYTLILNGSAAANSYVVATAQSSMANPPVISLVTGLQEPISWIQFGGVGGGSILSANLTNMNVNLVGTPNQYSLIVGNASNQWVMGSFASIIYLGAQTQDLDMNTHGIYNLNSLRYATSVILGTATTGPSITGATLDNIAIGAYALNTATTSDHNIALGYESLKAITTTGTSNGTIGIGYQSLKYANAGATGLVSVGYQSLSGSSSTTNTTTVAFGYKAGYDCNSSDSVLIGHNCVNSSSGQVTIANCIIIGPRTTAFTSTTTGLTNTILFGKDSGAALTSGTANLLFGYNSGAGLTTGGHNSALGINSLSNALCASVQYNCAFGENSMASQTGSYNAAYGCLSMSATSGSYSAAFGYNALPVNANNYSSAFGYQAGLYSTGARNSYFGATCGYANSSGTDNSVFGAMAMSGFGGLAMLYNTAIGAYAMGSPLSVSTGVTSVGYKSSFSINGANYNTTVGYQSGYTLVAGSYNTLYGSNAGYSLSSATNCVMIGNDAGYNETGSYKLYIASSNTSTPLIKGDFNTQTLEINGQQYINNLTTGAGKSSSQIYNLSVKTTDATPTNLKTNNNVAYISIPSNASWYIKLNMIARKSGGAGTEHFDWEGGIENVAGTPTIVNVVANQFTTVSGIDSSSFTITNTGSQINFVVTGVALTTISWSANVNIMEIND